MADAPTYICELPSGNYRYSTKAEISAAQAVARRVSVLESKQEKIKNELRALKKGCKHQACYDTPGDPYDTRTCIACGHSSYL